MNDAANVAVNAAADLVWVMVSVVLVLFMTPALALFYGGLVRQKNVLSVFMHCFVALSLVSLQWCLFGYSLAFAPSTHGLFGSFHFVGLQNISLLQASDGRTIPDFLFVLFQMMFAGIAPALIAGAFAERLRFSAFVVFTLAWTTLVYDPLCHWVWSSSGWLFKRGALDFAGGTVVHLSTGISALVFAIVLGPRLGYPKHHIRPHDLTKTVLGAGLLWVGWMGFNGGSALGANAIAVLASLNTHLAAAAGACAWAAVEWKIHKKASALGVASGLVAGLVAITPAAGFVGPLESILIGVLAGMVCYGGIQLKHRFGYDDALDAFGVHGVGGALGGVLTGVFASKVWNPAGRDGLLHGDAQTLYECILGIVACGAYAVVVTYALVKLIDKTIGLRTSEEEEHEGLDTSIHGEEAYVEER